VLLLLLWRQRWLRCKRYLLRWLLLWRIVNMRLLLLLRWWLLLLLMRWLLLLWRIVNMRLLLLRWWLLLW
jgi:hypothetical protein